MHNCRHPCARSLAAPSAAGKSPARHPGHAIAVARPAGMPGSATVPPRALFVPDGGRAAGICVRAGTVRRNVILRRATLKALYEVHSWIGLFLGLALYVMLLSGSVSLFV